MSDNLRRYRAICHALTQASPTPPSGHFARHLQTLAAIMSGIVGGKSTQLPHIATKVPDGSKPESRVKRFARWLDNDRIKVTSEQAPRNLLINSFSPRDARVGDGWQCR